MEYRFFIQPEIDACKRCLRTAYVGGEYGGEFKIHVANSDDQNVYLIPHTGELVFPERKGEGRTGLLHEMCRCKAFVFEAIEQGRIVYQTNGRHGTVERKGDADVLMPPSESTEGGEGAQAESSPYIGSPTGSFLPLNRGIDEQIRQRYRTMPMHTQPRLGSPFATVISNVMTSLINNLFKLFQQK